MKRFLLFIPLAATAVAIICTAMRSSGTRPMYTTDVAVADDGRIVFTNKGSRDVTVYDGAGKLLERVEFELPPTGVAIDGDWAYVTSSAGEGRLSKLSLKDYSVAYTTTTAMGACAPVVSADGETVYVCNRYKGTLSAVSAADGTVKASIAMLREPCAAVLSPDGRYLYVANFLPAQRADVDYVAAAVSVVECDKFRKVNDIVLSNGSNALRGIACSPDGKYVFVSHNLGRYQIPTSQLQQGWMNTNAVSVIDASAQSLVGSVVMDEPDRGAGGIWDVACDGRYLVTSQSGTHDVSVVDYAAMVRKLESYAKPQELDYDMYFIQDVRRRRALSGNGPRAICLKDNKVYVPTYFSDTLNVVDLEQDRISVVAYNPDRMESAVDIGERAFNDAALCYQNWQSCNGCHPNEGRVDGMNWDLMNDGIGNPKNCKSMLLSHRTPKCMISGIRDSAGLAVRAGYKFIQFCDVPEDIALCVDEYLMALEPLPSPYLVDGKLSAKAEEGKKLYEKFGCANCHSGPYYTDMKMHRIGEDIEFEQGWDTPTLVEVWRTAPYLFDGRAATMVDVFYEHKHGIDGKISRKEAEALAEYVNSL
ncbi:MAG: YVTN family beta-propeller repeat-containing protein [Alistipes sp.]|nr:YVTN family beta-propeller repeat-containing protein [Alistipes sp.]